jgi:uncharacterized membrane protein YkoI
MIKKIIVALLVVVAISGLVYATLGNSENKNITKNSTNNSTSPVKQEAISTHNTINKTTQTTISSAEAQKIASKYIQVSGATAGKPTLVKQDSKMVYIVPVIINGKNVGEIDIDAKTGKNIGGAGGSP